MSEIKVATVLVRARGIGRGCAIEMANAGSRVSLMSPSERSIELAAELGGIGRCGSVTETIDLQALVDDTIAAYGRIDAVVTNMGNGGGMPDAIRTVGFDPDFDVPLSIGIGTGPLIGIQ